MAHIALRIWSAIISTFALLATHSPASSTVTSGNAELGGIIAQRSKKPELFLEKTSTSNEPLMMLAAHRSHRSHSSHRSHYSGYGYRGSSGYNTGSSTGSYKKVSTSKKKAKKKVAKANVAKTNVADSKTKQLQLNNGGTIDCDYTWQNGSTINVLSKGKVLKYDASEINLQKSSCK